jgi:hypothetical protein
VKLHAFASTIWGRSIVLGSLFCLIGQATAAYTPESPEVREMTANAVKFLEGRGSDGHSRTLGGVCLRGLACIKYYRRYEKGHAAELTHPQVAAAVDAVRKSLNEGLDLKSDSINYSLGIAILFLCEIDGQQETYRSEIEYLVNILYAQQRQDGAWSYDNHQRGDTSQTQYGVLASWYAIKKGYQVPETRLRKGVEWLIRTQDPSGAIPYHGRDPGLGNYNRVRQDQIRLSMSPASLGCLYLADDLMETPDEVQPPDVFRPLKTVVRPVKIGVDPGLLRRAITDGNRWYTANYQLNIGKNLHYYLYSLERYHTMKAISVRTRGEPTPWYDAGVEMLAASQSSSGEWQGTRGEYISTSFSLLFLLRSMESATEDTADGTTGFGNDLPDNLEDLTADDLDRDGKFIKRRSTPWGIIPTIDPEDTKYVSPILPRFVDRQLRNVDYQVRRETIETIAERSDLAVVPHLIFALTDGDQLVMRTARNGLRRISRKFNGFGLTDEASTHEKQLAAKRWREWYQSMQPIKTVGTPSRVGPRG